MSTRTIIEINHDYLGRPLLASNLIELLKLLGSSDITTELNRAGGNPVAWGSGVRILGQRHHSDSLTLTVMS